MNPFDLSRQTDGRAQRATPRVSTASSRHSDRELVARASHGERAAVKLLFMRHHTRVYRFAARHTGSAKRGEAIAEAVFLEAWRRAPRFEARGRVSTWLLGIARDRAAALRRQGERPRQEEHMGGEAANDDEEGAALTRLIDTLPEEQRTVVDLAYYHGQSIEEIGEILDVPMTQVGARMLEARTALRKGLKSAGSGNGRT